MAVTIQPKTKSLVIEIQTDTDKAGDPIYGKKSFAGVKLAASDADVYEIAANIKSVIGVDTRGTLINEVNTLVNA